MTPTLAIMIGLAVAIDYSLFIVSRYRHELTRNDDRAEAAGRAVGTAGSAVVFAGLTVIIALVALRVVGIPFLSDMGLAAAFTVFIAVLIALTLLPAILGLFGGKAFAGKVAVRQGRRLRGRPAPGFAQRFIRTATKRPAYTLGRRRRGARAVGHPRDQPVAGAAERGHRRPRDQRPQGLRPDRRRLRPGQELAAVGRRRRPGIATVPAQEAFGKVVATIDAQTGRGERAGRGGEPGR